jgi:hypothetical protein
MKTKIFLILFFISIYGFSQSYKINEFCDEWYILPLLYNNYKSDSTIVKYWENYWYFRSENTNKLIPDTLVISLDLIPSMVVIDEEVLKSVKDSIYTIKSIINYKYGNYQDSYNVINPKISEDIVIYEQKVNHKKAIKEILKSEMAVHNLKIIKVPIREMLDSLNIYIFDRPDTNKINYYLNQIIITSYFINEKGEIKCSSEFTFPINGCYSDGNCCVYEF